MIPKDAKARCEEMIANAKEQTLVDELFHHVNPEDKPILYSDAIFKEVAIQWLIEMDQVCTLLLLVVFNSYSIF